MAIAGKIKAGKSTLLNALVGEELAPTDAGECTRIVTWYHRGDQPQVTVYPHAGPPEIAYFTRETGALDIELGGRAAGGRRPAGGVLADQPAQRDHPDRHPGHRVDLHRPVRQDPAGADPEDDRPPVVDAVLYLLRHTHASDVRFLESFHDDDLAHGTPMNAVGVLSRADEIGSCRLDALEVAERVGQRYQHEPRLRRLCPVIVPVAGLLGPRRGDPARTRVPGAGHPGRRRRARTATNCC